MMGVVGPMLKSRIIDNLQQAYDLGVKHGRITTDAK